jgi:hypothetical protein
VACAGIGVEIVSNASLEFAWTVNWNFQLVQLFSCNLIDLAREISSCIFPFFVDEKICQSDCEFNGDIIGAIRPETVEKTVKNVFSKG